MICSPRFFSPPGNDTPAASHFDRGQARALAAEVWFLTVAEFDKPAPSRTVKDDRLPQREAPQIPNGRSLTSIYRAVGRSRVLKGDPDQRNRTSAFDKGIQTPQASGMPTASQAKIE